MLPWSECLRHVSSVWDLYSVTRPLTFFLFQELCCHVVLHSRSLCSCYRYIPGQDQSPALKTLETLKTWWTGKPQRTLKFDWTQMNSQRFALRNICTDWWANWTEINVLTHAAIHGNVIVKNVERILCCWILFVSITYL